MNKGQESASGIGRTGAIKSVGHSYMECGGKRSATPLWLVFVPYPSQDEPLKPKRRRASLAAALHMAPGRCFNHTRFAPEHCLIYQDVINTPSMQPPEQPDIHSESFLHSLMRRQLRLSILCAAAFLLVLLGLPLANYFWPE